MLLKQISAFVNAKAFGYLGIWLSRHLAITSHLPQTFLSFKLTHLRHSKPWSVASASRSVHATTHSQWHGKY